MHELGPVGPFSAGVPEAALVVHAEPLDRFGLLELRRAGRIAATIAWNVAAAAARWVRHPRSARFVDAVSDGVVCGLEALGPTFVKLGQLMASASGVFPQPLADAALRTLDRVPPESAAGIRAVVEADLGHPIDELFTWWDDVPLGSASVAQVHACRLRDGTEAVVKVQRPEIADRMVVDLRAAYWGAKRLERIEFFRIANATAIIRDLHAVTVRELNSAVEAQSQSWARANLHEFDDNYHVTIPKIYWDYCGLRVICMERMYGVPLDRYQPAPTEDPSLLVRRGVKVWLEAVLVHGVFHGDVHAGNLWVLDDGRVAFLDFGIIGRLTDPWRNALRALFHGTLFGGDYLEMARTIRATGLTSSVARTDDEVGVLVAAALAPILARDFGHFQVSQLITALVGLARDLGVTTPEELVLFGKQIGYFERYATRMAPGLVLGSDFFLFRNVFPGEAAERAAQLGIELPDD